jgi:chaperonin GroES
MLLRLSTKLTINKDVATAPNLCDRFEDSDLTALGQLVWKGYLRDELSREDWKRRTSAAMDLAMQVQKDKSFPWPGCANVVFPLVTIAALQFSSRSYSNIIQGTDVVKYRVIGKDPDQRLRERADRISRHMSWQVLEEDTAWEEQHDRLLINLGIIGCNFVKTYYSPSHGYNVSELVMARDFVLDYWAKSVEDCARKTQIIPMYRNDIYEKVVDQTFRKGILESDWFNSVPPTMSQDQQTSEADKRKGLTPAQPDEDTPFRMLEQHRLLDLDQDGYYEPYTVTIDAATQNVCKLTARWEREEDVDRTDFPGTRSRIRHITPTEYFTKYGFIPAPDGGIYDIGFGTLLGPLNESVNTGINQLLDAGTMSNSNGGFLGRGVKIRGGVYTMAPWTWKRVDSTGVDLKNNMIPTPVREPSDVMFKLLGLLIEYTDRIAGTTDPMVGMNPGQNTPAETSRNTMEQGMKVYSSIFKRVWRSFKEEFKKRHRLNALFLESRRSFGNKDSFVTQEDYRSNPDLVVPAADPNVVSDGQRLSQAAAMREAAHSVPGYAVPEVEKNFLRALKVDSIDHFYPGPEKTPPLPNFKIAVEQLKLQGIEMKLKAQQQQFVMDLMAAKNKTQAEIVKIYAEVGKLLAETQTEQVKAKVEAFSAMVEAFKTHNDMLTQQIEAASGGQDGGGKEGGLGGVEAQPGNSNVPAQVPTAMPAGANGAMGGAAISR